MDTDGRTVQITTMLRVRTTKGQSVTLPEEARFVEICSEDGRLACVFVLAKGQITEIRAGMPEAARYTKRYGINWVPIVG